MLVLARKLGERVRIGDDISITVVKLIPGGVRIGIEAPAEMAIVREELALELEAADQAEIDAAAVQDAERDPAG